MVFIRVFLGILVWFFFDMLFLFFVILFMLLLYIFIGLVDKGEVLFILEYF